MIHFVNIRHRHDQIDLKKIRRKSALLALLLSSRVRDRETRGAAVWSMSHRTFPLDEANVVAVASTYLFVSVNSQSLPCSWNDGQSNEKSIWNSEMVRWSETSFDLDRWIFCLQGRKTGGWSTSRCGERWSISSGPFSDATRFNERLSRLETDDRWKEMLFLRTKSRIMWFYQ